MRLKEKVAIVTGSTDGIGRATAVLFADEGASVAVVGRREELGAEIVAEIKARGGEAIFVKTDITKEDDVNNLVDVTVRAFGKLDILVNNAAAHWLGTILTAKPEDYDKMFTVNVRGYGMACRAAIPHLRKSRDGNIVNVASVNGVLGMPAQSIYNASKAAIISLSNSMAIDFPELRINTVLPGFTLTPSIEDSCAAFNYTLEEGCRRLAKGVLRGRLAQPVEVAKGILFLASEDASYMTASEMLIDGGIGKTGDPAGAFLNDPRLDEALGRKGAAK